jgi:hypothetical protein
MYTERVSIRRGPSPILLVAPHAAPGDDVNTDIIIDQLADLLDCNAVVNRGWRRGDTYDYYAEIADCNKVDHMVDVVKDEFLSPLLNLKTQILRRSPLCHLFFIHGMAAQKGVDVVIGYGAGTPNSFSCTPWRKNLMYTMLENTQMDVFIGKAGGNYSGWARNNMNQYFRKHAYDTNVQSMQIELSRELRTDRGVSELTAEYLATAMGDYINYDKFEKVMSPAEI